MQFDVALFFQCVALPTHQAYWINFLVGVAVLSWFYNDIAWFVFYSTVGFICLAWLVKRPVLTRLGRFAAGLCSILYGALGSLLARDLSKSIWRSVKSIPWDEVQTPLLIGFAQWVDLGKLVIQFSFAAVGVGLVVNAIIAGKDQL